jgi:hypothetical protein
LGRNYFKSIREPRIPGRGLNKCRFCGVILSDENWKRSSQVYYIYICRECTNLKRNKTSRRLAAKQNGISDEFIIRDSIFYAAKKRAKKKKITFDLVKEDIVIPIYCPILHVELIRNSIHDKDFSPSLDRIDSDKGYLKDNIAVISLRANRIKNDATLEELRKLVMWLENKKNEN